MSNAWGRARFHTNVSANMTFYRGASVKRNRYQSDQTGKSFLLTPELFDFSHRSQRLSFALPRSAPALPPPVMSIGQVELRQLWLSAPDGRICPWELSKALGLRDHGGKPNLPWIAPRVAKVGGGSPGKPALRQFFAMVDADGDWVPGKHSGKKRGPKPRPARVGGCGVGLSRSIRCTSDSALPIPSALRFK